MNEWVKYLISIILSSTISIIVTILTLRYKIRKEIKYKKLYGNLENHLKLYKDLDAFLSDEALSIKGFFLSSKERKKIQKDLTNGQKLESKQNSTLEDEEELVLYDTFYNIYRERFYRPIENVMRLSTPDIQKLAKKINTNYIRVNWNIDRLQEDYPQPDQKELEQYENEKEQELEFFCIHTAPLLEKLLIKLEKIIEYKK